MKKILSIILVLCMLVSLCACGSSDADKDGQSEKQTENSPAVSDDAGKSEEKGTEEKDAGAKEEDAAWDRFEDKGMIKTEEGVETVTITFPADFIGEDITQEEVDAEAGTNYISGTVNSDGSLTYVMTKAQHKALVDEFNAGVEESFNELISDESYSISKITHNSDYTVYDVTMKTNEVGFDASIFTMAFYLFSAYYAIFACTTIDNVVVNYYAPDGSLIESSNSADLGF